ncbi:MAG: tetratricopeptide repeat protein [FCB group bacterium]|jgi:predicted Zn-dependent protease|nr:tetratricopeptide repeat protein [FCB group bacterium]
MNPIATSGKLRYAALLAAVVCCALLAGGCNSRRAEQHRKTGDTYLHLGKLKEAAQEYDSALALDAKNARAQFGRGAVLARQHKNPEALAEFEKTLTLDPKFEPAYVESMRMLLADKKYPEAEALAKRLQGANAEPGDVMLAGIYLETDRSEEAVKLLEARKAASPQSTTARIALAKAYLASEQPEKAEAELQAMVDQGGANVLPARMALVEVYRAEGKLDKTVDELKALIAERPDDSELKLVLSRSLLESGRVKEAYDAAEPVLQQAPDNPWANFIIGSCLVAQKSFAEAIPYLETAARKLPQQPALERELALARSAGKSDKTDAPAIEASGQSPVSPADTTVAPAAIVEAPWQTLWQQAKLTELLDNRARFLQEHPDDVLLKETLVLAALFAGRSGVAQEMVKSLPAESPAAVYVQKIAADDIHGALEAMKAWQNEASERKILERNATGVALAVGGLRGQALLAFADAGRLSQENTVYLENLARMYRAAQMPDFAAGALQKLLSRYPENIEARQLLFQVYLDSGKLSDAKSVAENMYGLFPGEREAVLSLAQIYTLLGQTDLASDVLSRGMEKYAGDAGFTLALASVLLAEDKPGDAQALIEKAGEIPPGMDRMRRHVLALAQAAQGNWAGAAETAAGGDPAGASGALRVLLAAALIATGNTGEALKAVQRPDGSVSGEPRQQVLAKALGANVEGMSSKQTALAAALAAQPAALAQYAYGLACLEAGLATAAYNAFDSAAQQTGEHPYLVLGRMDALAKLPESSDRVERGRVLAQQHADMAEAWVGLSTLLMAVDDLAGAREAVDKASALGPEEPLVWVQRGILADKQNDLGMAVEAFQKLTALEPQNPSFHNNYAYYLLESNGDASAALREAQAAHDRMPGNPNVLHTLGLAELRTGDTQKAFENLRNAVERRPGDPTLLLDFGQVLIKMNQADEGRRHVVMALQCAELLQLDFPRKAEAQSLVQPAASAGG